MKLAFIFCLLIFCRSAVAQKKITFDSAKNEIIKNYPQSIFLITRGTKTKQNIISKGFSLVDSNTTHIGIGLWDAGNNRMSILNVNSIRNKNALTLDNFETYSADPDIFYISIWVCELSKKEYQKTIQLFSLRSSSHINFDFDFDLHNDKNTLYCSEFCWSFLNELDSEKFSFKPTTKTLINNLQKLYLKKSKIEYIPVDFFETSKYFKKIFESKI